MKKTQVLEIKEGFGYTGFKRAFFPFLIGGAVIFMYYMNGTKEGELPSNLLFWVAGCFFLLGLIALFYRRRLVIDKLTQTVTSSWSLFFYNVKHTYPMREIVGLYLQIGYKPTVANRDITSDNRSFSLKMNTNGKKGAEESEYYILVYRSDSEIEIDVYIEQVSSFLKIEPKVIDYRTGIDAIISDYIMGKFKGFK